MAAPSNGVVAELSRASVTGGRAVRAGYYRRRGDPGAAGQVKILVIAVGRLRAPYADDVQHYQRLLAGHCKLEIVEVKEHEHMLRRLPERAFVSLLTSEGTTYDSIAFSRFIEERRMSGRDLCFVIGGPTGTELERADHRLSMGPMTFPHQLARVMLLEQIYRAHKILAREPYHY
jgi:23S rRNA (pseudouridine1915-N3)-methyltransferase